jgi:hypothetical protein
VGTLKQYISCVQNILNTYHFRVLVAGDFNVPGFDWRLGLFSSSSHYYNKFNGEKHTPPRVDTAYLSIIILARMPTCINLRSPVLLIFLLNMMYMTWCALMFTTLLMSQNLVYLLRDQIYLPASFFESTFMLIT